MDSAPAPISSTANDPIGTVLILDGASGTGKTTLAKRLSAELGIAWVQVDDLRLALQRSSVRMPAEQATEALYFFERTPDVWSLPAERPRDGLIATGEAMTEAIAIVAENHIAQNDPAVIEGDSVLPELLDCPLMRSYAAAGRLKAAFLMPASEDELLRNMIRRGRGVPDTPTNESMRIAEMNWLYSAWLEAEAGRRSIAVLPTTPRESLVERARNVWDR